MKIFIDIGHPAHVHYFRNFIKIMEKNGHKVFITARNKEVSHHLLKSFNLPYYDRGKGSSSLCGKIFYMLKADYKLLLKARSFRPDIFLSFASPYAAHVAKLMRKPHISFTDTENAKLGILSFAPFTDCILTPETFQKNFRGKHIRFKGFMELCYLHPRYYKPDSKTLKSIGIENAEPFAILRFVSWGANHDIGHSGLTEKEKIEIAINLSKKMKVFISSEGELPAVLENFRINVSPDKIHDILAFAKIFITEGATMASESVMLNTPTIYVNSLMSGTLESQTNYGSLFCFKNGRGVIEKIYDILYNKVESSKDIISEHIDVTLFMVWFIENFPESVKIMENNYDFQFCF